MCLFTCLLCFCLLYNNIIIITLFESQIILAEHECCTNWGDCKSNKSNQIKCWFLRRGENRSSRRKTSRSRVENQQTQSTYDAGSGNRTRDTLVEGERSHHYANPAPRAGLALYIDAMAYRGDLMGCTIKFENEEDGKVPVVFTLNGRRITDDEIWIDYTPGGKLMYPYIGMGYKGIRVSAKVCTINSAVYHEGIYLINFRTATAPLYRSIFLPIFL